jgi:ribonuclease T2
MWQAVGELAVAEPCPRYFMEQFMGTFAARLAGAVALSLMALGSAHAEVAMTGTFTATQACPAFQSFRKSTNPGDVKLETNKTYRLIAKNKPEPSHYRIMVEGAEPVERWVSTACGSVAATDGSAHEPPAANAAPPAPGEASGTRATHVLAMGWEPAFCEEHHDKAECRQLGASSFAGTHLILHGLWPQPRGTQYCNVAADVRQTDRGHNWDGLPEPEMSAATLKRLGDVMPGVQSKLQRHEWIVHGTCFGGNADGYFSRAAGLAEAVSASKISQLFADNVGKSLSADAIRAAFDQAFGAGAGARVAVSCKGHGGDRKITELTVGLAGDVTGSADIGTLIKAAAPAPAGCPGGMVERAQF